jgi:hypothetical protein
MEKPLTPEKKLELGARRNRASETAAKIGVLNAKWFDLQNVMSKDNDILSLDAFDLATEDFADEQFDEIIELEKIAASGLYEYIAAKGIKQLQFKEGTSWPLPLALYAAERSKPISIVAEEDYRQPRVRLRPSDESLSQVDLLDKKRELRIEVLNASESAADILLDKHVLGMRRTLTIAQISDELYPNSDKPKSVLHNQTGQIMRNPQIKRILAEREGGFLLGKTTVKPRGSKKQLLAFYAERVREFEQMQSSTLTDDEVRAELSDQTIRENLGQALESFDKSLRSPTVYKRDFVWGRLKASFQNSREIIARYSTPEELRHDSLSLRTRLMVAYFSNRPHEFTDDELRPFIESIAGQVLDQHVENLRKNKSK